MNWYLENGKDSDIIVSSRIRLARNIKDFPFKIKMTKEDKERLLEKVKFVTPSLGYGLKFLHLKKPSLTPKADREYLTVLTFATKDITKTEMKEELISLILMKNSLNSSANTALTLSDSVSPGMRLNPNPANTMKNILTEFMP